MGMLLYGVTFFAAPYCAAYFGNPEITNLIRAGGLASLFGALSIVHRSILQRRLKYGHLARIEIISAFAGSTTALIMALSGCGVWSLLGSMLAYNILSSIILLTSVAWPQGSYLHLKPAKTLGLFGAGVVAQRIAEYGAQNFDFIVVGKAFGEQILGVYSIAFTIVTLPQVALGVVIGNVLMSMVSRIQNDDKQLGDVFLKLSLFTSIISVPFFVIIFSYAHEMMHAVSFINHGNKWLPAASLLRILTLLGLLYTFSSYPGTIWLAKGKVKLRIFWAVVMFISVVISVFAGLPFGIKGICFALVIRGLIFFPVILFVTYRVIGLKPLRYIKTLQPSITCGIIMPLSRYIPGTSFARDIWVFLGGSILGLLLYGAVLKLFFKNSFAIALNVVKMRDIKLW
jgi:O-antigen/teichoic acid export membrane protein